MSNKNNDDSRISLRVRIGHDLKRRIRAGEWNAHTALPPERRLAEEYEVSLGTIRAVMSDLVDDNYVIREQGRGTFIHRGKFDKSFSRFFRMNTDGLGAADGHVLSISSRQATPDETKKLDLDQESLVVVLERERTLDGKVTITENIVLPRDRFQVFTTLSPRDLEGLLYEKYEAFAGVLINSATEVLSIRPATQTETTTLQLKAEEPVVVIERIAQDLAGYPVELRTSVGGSFNFKYRIEIS